MSDETELSATEPASPPLEAEPPLPSLGEMLIAARERQGLSAGDVARTLRLGLRQIEALETNRFEALPGNTFIRGFLRNYAKIVQGDGEAFLAAYERTRPQPAAPEIIAPTEQIDYMRKSVPRWVWYATAVVVTAVAAPLLIYAMLQEDEAPARVAAPSGVPAAPAPAAAPVARAMSSEVALSLPPATPVASGQPAAPPEQTPAAVSAVAPAPGVLIPLATPSPASVPDAATQPKLVLRFAADAWVEIRDKSGAKIFSQVGKRGTEETVQGAPPFALVVGNAAQVSVTYKGKSVDLAPHVKVNVARLSLE